MYAAILEVRRAFSQLLVSWAFEIHPKTEDDTNAHYGFRCVFIGMKADMDIREAGKK